MIKYCIKVTISTIDVISATVTFQYYSYNITLVIVFITFIVDNHHYAKTLFCKLAVWQTYKKKE